jgi:nitroreductase
MIRNNFTRAMTFRHACKRFDETRRIDEATMRYILEAGRMSPSSFGQEPWRFIVVTSESMKEALQKVCWDQPQLTTASHVVVILAAIEPVRPRSGIPQKRFSRRPLPPEKIEAYIRLYGDFLADTFASDEKTFCWTARQTYIALANMMTAAAYVGVDSCPIEGFEKRKLEDVLKLDTTQWQVSVVVTLGYRVDEPAPHQRLPFEEVVRYWDE